MSYIECARKFYNPKIHTSIWYVLLIIGSSYDKVIIKNYTPRKLYSKKTILQAVGRGNQTKLRWHAATFQFSLISEI